MKTILVVDDDTTNLVAAKNALDGLYKVVPVPSGEQALKYLQTQECDLCLLDIDMPKMDGIETLKQIREMATCRDLAVIFLTANRYKETVLEGSKLGILDYITKPFKAQVLKSRIQETFKKLDALSFGEDLYLQLEEVYQDIKRNRVDMAVSKLESIMSRLRS